MKNFINKVFTLLSFIVVILSIIVGIAWLFDCKPHNLYYALGISCDCIIVSFLFFILFGGNKN